jgi:hypothetical protein
MPTAKSAELPTRRAVSLRSRGPGSGVGDIFQLIYSTITGIDRVDEHEFLSGGGVNGSEGEGAATGTSTTDRIGSRLITFLIRIPAYNPTCPSTSAKITLPLSSPPRSRGTIRAECITPTAPVRGNDVGRQVVTTNRLLRPLPLTCGAPIHRNGRGHSRSQGAAARLLRPLTSSLHKGTTIQNLNQSEQMLAHILRTAQRCGGNIMS